MDSIPKNFGPRKHSELQHPSSREIPNFKHPQTRSEINCARLEVWNLRLLWGLDVEVWNFLRYCLSYSPLLTFFSTVNPAFFASEIESDRGELKDENTFRTGFLHAGHCVSGAADNGRRKTNFPPHTLQSPLQSSYSYKGIRPPPHFFKNGPNKSIGTGKNVVVLCSLEISRIVCK